MSLTPEVEQDERTRAAANLGGICGSVFVSFALLIDVMYRNVFRHKSAWDLMAFIAGGGAVSAIYQIRQKTWKRGWKGAVELVILIAGFILAMIFAVIDFWPK